MIKVLQFYGSLGNAELLLDYGFVIDNNPFDAVLIDVDLLGVDPEGIKSSNSIFIL